METWQTDKTCPEKMQKKFFSSTDINNCQNIMNDPSDDQSACGEIMGDHETQLVETSEADLPMYQRKCKKNPGHKEFISVATFSMEHLPEGLRDVDVYKLIKATADLTVRVDVRMTSSARPELLPKTNIPYPFCKMRESKTLRIGSGRIHGVEQFIAGVDEKYGFNHWKCLRNCWCKNCKGSASPSNVWWEFDVFTATHVVFDDIEARHTSLRLFYDSDDSQVVIFDNVRILGVNIEFDMCELKCVTCDKNLGKKLKEIWKHYEDVCSKVLNKYQKSKDVFKFNFIVSHPHGLSKQISIGQWKNKYRMGSYWNKFTYTTCTCQGSSGANVHCLGYKTGGWFSELVHSGSKSGLNQSGVGSVY